MVGVTVLLLALGAAGWEGGVTREEAASTFGQGEESLITAVTDGGDASGSMVRFDAGSCPMATAGWRPGEAVHPALSWALTEHVEVLAPEVVCPRAGAAEIQAVRHPPLLGQEARGPVPVRLQPQVGGPLDLIIARQVRASGLQSSRVARAVAAIFRVAAIPGTVLLAATLYGGGELGDNEQLAELGLHTAEAIAVAGAVTAAGKMLVGRARPHASPTDPLDLSLGRGLDGDDYQSFPSAHTAAAFAAASLIGAELGKRHPDTSPAVGPAAFGAASLAGFSRILDEEHWATDVLAGALIGILAGWGVAEAHGF